MEDNQLLQKISTDLDGLKTDMQEVKQNTADILEIVNFIQENAASKEDLKELATGTAVEKIDKDMDTSFTDIKIQLQAMDIELEDIKRRLDSIELRTKDDDDVIVKDVIQLRERVNKIEKNLRQLQSAHI